MTARQSIEVEGFGHGSQPIPAASRLGNLVITGGIYGLDPATGQIPDDLQAQAEIMFQNLRRVLDAAGASLDQVVKVTVFVKGAEGRLVINEHWVEAFPDPASRPARHVLHNEHMPANMLIQCDATACLG